MYFSSDEDKRQIWFDAAEAWFHGRILIFTQALPHKLRWDGPDPSSTDGEWGLTQLPCRTIANSTWTPASRVDRAAGRPQLRRSDDQKMVDGSGKGEPSVPLS